MEGAVIIADSKGRGYRFARGVYEYVLRKEERDFSVNLADLERTTFRDGEYKLKISHNLRRKNCIYIHDPNKFPQGWTSDLLFTLEAMWFSSPSEINVVFPYERFARQDRKDESRVSVNMKAIADVVSHYARRGMAIDLHTPQIPEYFGIPFDNLGSFPVLVNHLIKNKKSLLENLVVVSPDEGGAKRAGALRKRLAKVGVKTDLAICYKRKEKDNEIEETRVMGDVKEKNCLMVDDIIDTGGTIVSGALALKKEGAEKVFAWGTHGLFTKGTKIFGALDGLMVSDTVYRGRQKGIEVVSMVDLLGEAVYRTIVGESLSSLFNK